MLWSLLGHSRYLPTKYIPFQGYFHRIKLSWSYGSWIVGPCPPCPQTVLISCYCGKSTPTTKRCSASAWSCNTECGKLLSCGIHSCQDLCHPGSCSPCKKTSIRSCCCGKAKEPRPCSSPPWKCGTKCGKLLKCGFHSCDSICHTEGKLSRNADLIQFKVSGAELIFVHV